MGRGLNHDKDGAIVLDFNPEHFSWILNYLRAKKISTPKNPPVLPRVPKDQKENFDILFDYLGLGDELTRLTEKFNLRSSQVSLQETEESQFMIQLKSIPIVRIHIFREAHTDGHLGIMVNCGKTVCIKVPGALGLNCRNRVTWLS